MKAQRCWRASTSTLRRLTADRGEGEEVQAPKYEKGDVVVFRFLGTLIEREVIDEPWFDCGEYTYDVGFSQRVLESGIEFALTDVSRE